jgi:hypothetical protein
MGTGKAITIAAIVAAIVGGFMSEIGKDAWAFTKQFFNDHVQITFNWPSRLPSDSAAPKKAIGFDGGDYDGGCRPSCTPKGADYIDTLTLKKPVKPKQGYDIYDYSYPDKSPKPKSSFDFYPDQKPKTNTVDTSYPAKRGGWDTTGFTDFTAPMRPTMTRPPP